MTKPYVEGKYKKLLKLMRQLKSIQSLDYQECKEIYKKPKTEIKKDIYELIAKTAKE